MSARGVAATASVSAGWLLAKAPLIVFAALLVFLAVNAPYFLTWDSIAAILNQSVPLALLAMGLAVVVIGGGDDVISGGIDISLPAAAVLAAAVISHQLTIAANGLAGALPLGLLAALTVGAVNALLVVRVGLTPLLATLATSVAAVGVTKVVTSNRRIDVADPFILYLRDGSLLGVPVIVFLAVAVFAILGFLVHRTRWGMHLQAIGANRAAAEVLGLPANRAVAVSYLIAAGAAAVASLAILARGSGSSPGSEEPLLLEMVLATFLGAAFSRRRIVTVWGALTGAILVTALSYGFALMQVDIFWVGGIKGVLILFVLVAAALSEKVRGMIAIGMPMIRTAVRRYAMVSILVAFVLFFALAAPGFRSASNLATILENSAVLLIVALAMTIVLAAGAIDLSLGVAIDFGAAFAMVALKDFDAPWYVAVLAALVGASLVGLLNAILVVKLGLKPFLATLGTFFVGTSVERIYTDGGGPIAFRRMDETFRSLATGDIWGIPNEVVIAGIVLIVTYLFLDRTVGGQRVEAIGLQQRAARVAGISVGRYLALVFISAAAISALGGVILAATLRQFTPLGGNAYLLDAIAAVFIGASVHPRLRPNAAGTLLGVLFLGVVANGFNMLGLDFNLKDALSGLVLVGALALAGLTRAGRAS